MKVPSWTGLAHKNLFILTSLFYPIIFYFQIDELHQRRNKKYFQKR
jgi:hypothetical protein